MTFRVATVHENDAPQPDFLYLSRKHQNAITSLDFGLMDDAGLILFTGDIGTGKTTLIHHILRGATLILKKTTVLKTGAIPQKKLNDSFTVLRQSSILKSEKK
jgi:type II secretory pathway predicted ATPase ExeA